MKMLIQLCCGKKMFHVTTLEFIYDAKGQSGNLHEVKMEQVIKQTKLQFMDLNPFSEGQPDHYERFLAPLAVGQRAYVMVRCPSCVRPSVRPSVRASVRPCVRPSVRALTFSLNIFFAETTYRILMKFHRNVPTMVLFRIS